MSKKSAVVLLSGGLDSATTLYYARAEGFSCQCLIFDYGQRHAREVKSAVALARTTKSPYWVVRIPFPWKGSSLLDRTRPLRGSLRTAIPATYVPARNLIFLSFALSCAEAIKAGSVFIGANAVDFSGYPDCRPTFIKAFNGLTRVATKAGTEGRHIEIVAPLIRKTKAQIVRLGFRLGVPFELTWSCYRGGKVPCGRCDSCRLRAKGFKVAGIKDPLVR